MKEKCNKFEALFLFQDNSSLEKHLEECEECKKEKEKFDKISSLLQEAKPLYFARKRKAFHLKTACAVFLLVLSGTIFTTLLFNDPVSIADTLRYGQTLSAEDYGFPVDAYGLIMVDE